MCIKLRNLQTNQGRWKFSKLTFLQFNLLIVIAQQGVRMRDDIFETIPLS